MTVHVKKVIAEQLKKAVAPECKACSDTGKNSRGGICKACGGENVELQKEMERAEDRKKISKPKQIVKTKTKVEKKVAVKRVMVKTAKVKPVEVKPVKVKATKKAAVKKAAVKKEVKPAKEEPKGLAVCHTLTCGDPVDPNSNNWMLTRLKNSAVLAFTDKAAYQFRRELRGKLDKCNTLDQVKDLFAPKTDEATWQLFLSHFFNLHKF